MSFHDTVLFASSGVRPFERSESTGAVFLGLHSRVEHLLGHIDEKALPYVLEISGVELSDDTAPTPQNATKALFSNVPMAVFDYSDTRREQTSGLGYETSAFALASRENESSFAPRFLAPEQMQGTSPTLPAITPTPVAKSDSVASAAEIAAVEDTLAFVTATGAGGAGGPVGMEGNQVEELGENMERARDNLDDLGDKLDTAGDTARVARKAMEQATQLEKQADGFLSTVKSARFTLKISEKAGPLKVVSKLLDAVLEKVEEVATHVTFRAGQLREKIEDGNYINKLKTAESKLKSAEAKVKAAEFKAAQYEQTVKLLDFVLKNDGGVFGTPNTGVEGGLNTALVPVNDTLDALNTVYEDIAGFGGELDLLRGEFNLNANLNNFSNVFDVISDVAASFGSINSSLDFLAKPLKALHNVLKPIEWALDLVGFVFDITVGPVLEWALETLGINDIMDRVADAITSVLPSKGILNNITNKIDEVMDEIEAFISESANSLSSRINQLVEDLEEELMDQFDSQFGFSLKFGTDNPDTITGANGDSEFINPLGGNDLVTGASSGTGNAADIFFASAGQDTLRGGDSDNDFLVLPGFVTDFKIVQVAADAPVVFYDREGRFGFEIVDYINGSVSIEKFVFLDAQAGAAVYTLAELDDLGLVQDGGDAGPDFLIGGAGRDLFVHTDGLDSIRGNDGRDTWLLPETGVTQGNTVVNLSEDPPFSDGQNPENLFEGRAFVGGANNSDFLDSIEDVILQQDREFGVFGSAKNNLIISNDSDDLLVGRAGKDKILGGGGGDLIVGGDGADRAFGEDGNDTIFGGDVEDGEGNIYDGGADRDTLIYSTNTSDYNLDSPKSGTSLPSSDLTDSGPLKIDLAKGQVQHLSEDLNTIRAVDQVTGFEVFIGGDDNDTIKGVFAEELDGVGEVILDGGEGDDLLLSRGADEANGGQGDDLFRIEPNTKVLLAGNGQSVLVPSTQFDGDTGVDTLDLSDVENARWALSNNFGSGINLRGFEVQDTEALIEFDGFNVIDVQAPTILFSGTTTRIERYVLGDNNDYLIEKGTEQYDVFAGGGNDVIVRKQGNDGSSFHNFYGEAGNDYLEISGESGNIFGGTGDDTIAYDSGSTGIDLDGGEGDDLFQLSRFSGSTFLNPGIIQGGDGFDVLAFIERFDRDTTGIRVDLSRFGMTTSGPFSSSFSDYWEGLIFDVEGLIGSEFTDSFFKGTSGNERFIGLGANDTFETRGGDDELFGGGGNDLLDAGKGSDLIHMGTGDDTVDGGDDIDTLTFSNARPESSDGTVIAGNFGSVQVFLTNATRISDFSFTGSAGQVRGVFGTGDIYEVENVIGSQGDDNITGNSGDNALTGSGGDDTLFGYDGNDILIGGEGDDKAIGGRGNDRFLVTPGANVLIGGEGQDVADFSLDTDSVQIDLNAKTYTVQIREEVAVWANNGNIAVREYDGQMLLPSDVQEVDPIFSNDDSDLTRVLPEIEEYFQDPKPPRLDIEFDTRTVEYTGSLTGIEEINGSQGDDIIKGSGVAETINGNGGDDSILGGWGQDNLFGGAGDDTIRGDNGDTAPDGVDLVYMNETGFLDYLQTANFTNMPTQRLTFEAMVKGLDTSPGNGGSPTVTLFSYAVPNSTNEFTIIYSSTSTEYSQSFLTILINGSTITTTVPMEALFDNALHRLSVTWDGIESNVAVFIDGVKVFEDISNVAADGPIGSGGTLIIGQDQDGSTPGNPGSFQSFQKYEGGVGDIRLFNEVRSDEEIAQNADGPLDTLPGSLAGYWQVDANGETLVNTVGPVMQRFGDLRYEEGAAADTNTHDYIEGGEGDDDLAGWNGQDTILGQDGNDTILGGNSGDSLTGGKGNDDLQGGTGQDFLGGGSGADTLNGDDGDDTLLGGNGADELKGGRDRDQINGGKGDDYLVGGTQNDTFIFENDWGNDTIKDFAAADSEKIDLSDVSAITGFNDLVNNHLSQNAGVAVITVGTNKITLTGFSVSDFASNGPISVDDFIF